MGNNALNDFINDRLTLAMFGSLDRVFPNWNFTRDRSGKWITNFRLNKTPSSNPRRRDRSIVSREYPKYLYGQVEKERKSLIDIWMEEHGTKDVYEAVEAISSLLGVSGIPERGNSQKYEERQKKINERERLLSMMRKALNETTEGGEVIDYLCGGRNYKGDYVDKLREWGIGCLTPEIAAQLGDNAPYDGFDHTAYKLVIPYYSRGELIGFTYRDITGSKSPKYLFMKGNWKGSNLFGLTGLKLTGDREKDHTLYIVEGQMDALHAQLEGFENIVAAGGTSLNIEALKQAKARGVERVVIIFDSEGDPQKDKQRDENREKALHLIHSLGMEGFSVTIPTKEGEKTDIDSYLNNHTLEDLEREIEVNLKEAGVFFYDRIKEKALTKFKDQKQGEIWNPLLISEFLRDLLNLLKDPHINQVYKEKILEYAEYDTGMDRNALRKEAEKLKAADDIARHQEETKRITEQASILAKAGKAEEAMAFLSKELPRLSQMKRETEFSSLLTIPSVESFKEEMKLKREGIQTPYELKKDRQKETFTLPSGAITLICAPTSHGKSTMLQNLALQIATDGKEGSVIYFTFEEEASSVKLQMLNKFLDVEITSQYKNFNNLTTLAEYYRTGSDKFFKAQSKPVFQEKEPKFWDLLSSGKIRIFRENWDAVTLRDAIAYLCKNIKVKAVFIDYIQLLKIEGFKGERRLELSDISKMYNNLAIDCSIPIVMGAQLNREAGSPLEMHAQNLAESADIERYANTILTLWNSSFKPTTKADAKKQLIDNFEKDHGISLGTGGQIYAKIIKNRGGLVGIEGVFDYNGNTGVISQEIEDKAEDNTTEKYAEIDEQF